VASVAQPTRPKYTAADAQRLLDALFELHEIIHTNSHPILRSHGFSRAWYQEPNTADFTTQLNALHDTRQNIRSIASTIYDDFYKKYQYYLRGDLQPIIAGDGILGEMNDCLNRYIEKLQIIVQESPEQSTYSRIAVFAISIEKEEFLSLLKKFENWVASSYTKINVKREEVAPYL
jgi:hypothetical protein